MGNDVLTIREMAEYLKVTEKTVYTLAQQRRIPSFKVGGQWRFRREDIGAWIDAQTEDAAAATSGNIADQPRRNGPRRGPRRTSGR
jgi:excisionase family DNA binding protein